MYVRCKDIGACVGKSNIAREAPLLLAVTKEGGHSMIWPTGLAGSRSWACDVFVEFVLAVAANNRKDQ